MNVRPLRLADHQKITHLIAGFRMELARLRNRTVQMDLGAAAELEEYAASSSPIFVAESGEGDIVGYLVCRVEGEVVWAESLYVSPAHRRRGVGSAL
jgi:GNAT superfamily N-acetyltransferase